MVILEGILCHATINFKMFIFNVYKNFFDSGKSFALLQKMLVFFMTFWW